MEEFDFLKEEYAYYISLVNGTSIGFISDINDLEKITRGIINSKFILIDNKCIDSTKIVFIGRVKDGSLYRNSCKENLIVITK